MPLCNDKGAPYSRLSSRPRAYSLLTEHGLKEAPHLSSAGHAVSKAPNAQRHQGSLPVCAPNYWVEIDQLLCVLVPAGLAVFTPRAPLKGVLHTLVCDREAGSETPSNLPNATEVMRV